MTTNEETVLLVPTLSEKTKTRHAWNYWVAKWKGFDVRPQYKARCYWCGTEGVLGVEIIIVGASLPHNLMCELCRDDPITMNTWRNLNWTSPNYEKERNGEFSRPDRREDATRSRVRGRSENDARARRNASRQRVRKA